MGAFSASTAPALLRTLPTLAAKNLRIHSSLLMYKTAAPGISDVASPHFIRLTDGGRRSTGNTSEQHVPNRPPPGFCRRRCRRRQRGTYAVVRRKLSDGERPPGATLSHSRLLERLYATPRELWLIP